MKNHIMIHVPGSDARSIEVSSVRAALEPSGYPLSGAAGPLPVTTGDSKVARLACTRQR